MLNLSARIWVETEGARRTGHCLHEDGGETALASDEPGPFLTELMSFEGLLLIGRGVGLGLASPERSLPIGILPWLVRPGASSLRVAADCEVPGR